VPGLNDAGEKHDEPLFPTEVMFYGHAVCWVLGETLEAARQGAARVEVDYEPLPALVSVHDAIEAGSYQGHQRTVSRGDAAAGLERPLPVQRRARDRRPGALLPGDQRRAGAGRRERPDLRPVSTQHPSETQDIVAHVLGVPRTRSPCSACAWGRFGGKEFQPHGLAAIAALGPRSPGTR
jgi:Xanthine dehydrogenase, molybdopterin-binding subunit B